MTMNVDPLIGRALRRIIGRVLDLTDSPAGTRLPDPDTGRTYLLYLHVPYCTVLCPFCSFHRVAFECGAATGYFEALRREIELVTAAGYRFDEVYIGGGTPTVLPGQLVETIRMLKRLHPVDSVSVETNPDDLDGDSLVRLRDAGVNRLSVGVQSLDDGLLEEMGRYEKYGSGAQIRERLAAAGGLVDTLNVDLIFNLPHQTEASLCRDMDILVDGVGVDQISFYPLMSVESTRKKMSRTMGAVDYSRERSFYRIIADRMLGSGYSRASAWCFSRTPGMVDEYIVDRDEYVGLGSGSFSYLDGSLLASTFSINHYKRLVAPGKTGTTGRRAMSERDRMRYYLLMRLFGGTLDLPAADRRFGGRFLRVLWPELLALRASGAVRKSGGRLSLTESGQYLWVMMMREFFTGVNALREQMRHRISRESVLVPRAPAIASNHDIGAARDSALIAGPATDANDDVGSRRPDQGRISHGRSGQEHAAPHVE